MPYTSAGKQAIADMEDVRKELRFALMEVGRQINSYLRRKQKRYERHTKKMTLVKYVPEVAKAVATLSGAKKKDLELKMMDMITKKYGENTVGPDDDKKKKKRGGKK